MHYIIQENLFREQHYDMLFTSMERLGLKYTVVRIFPFVDKIVALSDIPDDGFNVDDLPEFEPPTKNVFVFGAIKLARIASKKGWIPGSMMNKNHDFEVYSRYYTTNLLNYDSVISRVGSDFPWNEGEVKFIRPTRDTKAFTGKLFTKEDWKEMVEHNLHNFRSDQFNEYTFIQLSTPKRIYKEIRCWVVGGRIITASQYQLDGRFVLDDLVEPDAIEFAQLMVNQFKLAKAFVIDVCLTDNGWKIVECGCINCAGFYKCDIQKLVMAIDDWFSMCDNCIDMLNQTGMCYCENKGL